MCMSSCIFLLGMLVCGNRVEWVIKSNKSLYGLNQASENWFDLIKNGLERRGYHQSQVYPCVFTEKTQLF